MTMMLLLRRSGPARQNLQRVYYRPRNSSSSSSNRNSRERSRIAQENHCWDLISLAARSHRPLVVQAALHPRRRVERECPGRT